VPPAAHLTYSLFTVACGHNRLTPDACGRDFRFAQMW